MWYYLFLAVVALLWLGATAADRHSLTVVLIASIVSWLLVDYGTAGITRPWKLVVPGCVECGTVIFLLHGAPNRTALIQAVLVLIAWWSHLLCFVDLRLGSDIVYTNYEVILGAVSVAQILAFHDTYITQFRRLGRWWDHAGAGGGSGVRASSGANAVSPNPVD